MVALRDIRLERLPPDALGRPGAERLRVLAGAVPAGHPPLSTAQAMDLLVGSDMADKEADLAAALSAGDERTRILAAVFLARLATRAAGTALRLAVGTGSEPVRDAVALALARCGTAADLDALTHEAAARPRSRTAMFAAALLAHRHGRTSPSLPVDSEPIAVTPPAQEIDAHPADPAVAQRVLADLSAQPLGLRYRADSIALLRCPGSTRALVSAHADLNHPAVAAIVATLGPATQRYAASGVVLSTPQRDGRRRLLVATLRGEQLYAGTGRPDGTFSVRALQRPGALAVELAGELTGHGVVLTTARTGSVTPGRTPGPRETQMTQE
jgi:hypothetical protein